VRVIKKEEKYGRVIQTNMELTIIG